MADEHARGWARAVLPVGLRRWLRLQKEHLVTWPLVRRFQLRNLLRPKPISRVFGYDRVGLRVGRYYIEQFLGCHMDDIKGHVLEIGDDTYTRQFGGENVTQSDVLHVVDGNSKATIVADLTDGHQIPSEVFDCIVFTQTLQCIYDIQPALQTLYRILKPQGVLLITVSGISQISRYDMDRWGDYWRFTDASIRRLVSQVFGASNVKVETHGNVLAAIATLHGIVVQELRREELDYSDPDYQVLIAVRATKSPRVDH